MNRQLSVHTDGGCRNNPGKGAWAFLITENDKIVWQASGSKTQTTNNEMELMALYEAEKWLHDNADKTDKIAIYSDSMYAVKTITEWYDARVKKNKENELKNLALIKNIMAIYDGHGRQYDIKWIRGHTGNKYNEMSDEIVNEVMDRM